jgi:uncharacterized Tic20 family protein
MQTASQDERNWAMFANLAGLLIFVHVPFANVVGPLLIYLKARADRLAFAVEHARNALNFQITFSLFAVLTVVVMVACFISFAAEFAVLPEQAQSAGPPLAFFACLFVWLFIWGVALVTNIVLCVLGAIAASNGRTFHYPAIRFVHG